MGVEACSVHEMCLVWLQACVLCCCHQPPAVTNSQQMYADDKPLTSLNAAAYAASAASAARLHSASATPWHITGHRCHLTHNIIHHNFQAKHG